MNDGPIYWHPGLFLQPQHFQVLQERMTDALLPVATHLAPFFWGVASLAVNTGALAAGRLEIDALQLLFPSSAEMIRLPGNAVCAGRQLPPDAVPADGGITAYVGLRALKPGQVNVTEAESQAQIAAAPTRMAVAVAPQAISDLYGNAPPAKVRRMVYVLNLILESELDQAGDLELMPVVRLLRQGDRITLDPAFAPPSLTISAAPPLSALVRELRDRVLGKARQLESFKNLSAGQPASGDFMLLLMGLRTLSRYAARLDHASTAPCLSPWEAFGILKELVAELSVFSLNISVLGEDWQEKKPIPDYQHNRPYPCFRAAREVIIQLLEGISAGPRFATRFGFDDPCWSAQVPPQIISEAQTAGARFWLVLHSDTVPPDVLADTAGRLLKLSHPAGMESLLVRALPGIPLTLSDGPPQGMPRMQGAVYLRLGRESPLWAGVEKEGRICMHWSGAPQDLDAQLVLLAR